MLLFKWKYLLCIVSCIFITWALNILVKKNLLLFDSKYVFSLMGALYFYSWTNFSFVKEIK